MLHTLGERDIAVRSVSDGLDPATPTGRLMLNMLATLAEYERELIVERVKITGFGIRQGRRGMSVNYPSGNQLSPELPAWIEPGSSATWYGELEDGTALV